MTLHLVLSDLLIFLQVRWRTVTDVAKNTTQSNENYNRPNVTLNELHDISKLMRKVKCNNYHVLTFERIKCF